MDFPDLKKLDPAALKALRIQYLQLMEANRTGGAPDGTPTYSVCVDRKNAINAELRSRGENITASGISTAESKAKSQNLLGAK